MFHLKETMLDNMGEDETSVQRHIRDIVKEWGAREPRLQVIKDRYVSTINADCKCFHVRLM